MDERSLMMLNEAERRGVPVLVQGDWNMKVINGENSEFSGIVVHGTCEVVEEAE